MENINPKISVIVPVYNAEKYLQRCVDSILAQTFTDFELLLIDDGSKDKSGEICDEYVRKDDRVKVFHKENGGVSSARNLGLDNAQGIYVTFVDADDWIDMNYFPAEFLKDNKWDVVQVKRDGGSNLKCYSKNIVCRTRRQTINFLHQNFYFECWGRFIKKGVIGKFRFNANLKIGEDILFFISIFNSIENYFVVSDGGVYHYFINADSVMQNNKEEKDFNDKRIIDNLLLEIKENKNTLAQCVLMNFYLHILYKDRLIDDVCKNIGIVNLFLIKGLNYRRKLKFLFYIFIFKLKNR